VKNAGEKMKASLAMLLKTNDGKMSGFSSLAMLLKKQVLFLVYRDVDKNKGEICSVKDERRSEAAQPTHLDPLREWEVGNGGTRHRQTWIDARAARC